MTNVQQVSRKELTANEVIAIVEDGGRVIIEMSIIGKAMRVVIRRHSGTYYCDTPMKLLKFDTENGLRDCLERFRMVKPEIKDDPEVASVST